MLFPYLYQKKVEIEDIMDITFSTNFRPTKPRLRCYSSMNYHEYQDFFGTPPKMPQAPSSKPLQDPLEIPLLTLQTQAYQQQPYIPPTTLLSGALCLQMKHSLAYKMETIPEVDSSEANSIGFQSPHLHQEMFRFQMGSRMEDENEARGDPNQEDEEMGMGKRRRVRPRSFSESYMFQAKTRILDFLNQYRNRDEAANCRGRKQIKLD